MTKAELIKSLDHLPDDMEVMLSLDSEGRCGFSPLRRINLAFYRDEDLDSPAYEFAELGSFEEEVFQERITFWS